MLISFLMRSCAFKHIHLAILLSFLILFSGCKSETKINLVFSATSDNDLYLLFKGFPRYNTPAEAIAGAPSGAGVLLLAGGYPHTRTQIADSLFELAREKQLRLYIEYPGKKNCIAVFRF